LQTDGRLRGGSKLTILELPHASLDIVKGQVADLLFQSVEIHGFAGLSGFSSKRERKVKLSRLHQTLEYKKKLLSW
jgi:hypothetical protein